MKTYFFSTLLILSTKLWLIYSAQPPTSRLSQIDIGTLTDTVLNHKNATDVINYPQEDAPQQRKSDVTIVNQSLSATDNCNPPGGLYEYDPVDSQIELAWAVRSEQKVDLRWRVVGSSQWTVVQDLPTVAPNSGGIGTTGFYRLTGLTPGVAYEWAVQRICDATNRSAYTAPRTFTAHCGAPDFLVELQIQPTTAQVGWRAVDGTTYRVQYRTQTPVDSPWQTLPDKIMQGSGLSVAQLNNLASGTAYEWRVMTICSPTSSSDFSEPHSFTTTCAPPTNFFSEYATTTSTRVYWDPITPDAQYRVRWRRDGVENWTEGVPTTNTYYEVTSLQLGLYRFQVQRICDGQPGNYSNDYLVIAYCYPVSTLNTDTVTAETAQLRWSAFDSNTSYNIQWRSVGTESWPQSVTTSSAGSYTLTSLLPATNYEWRIQTLCSDGNVSEFSPTNSFTTLLPPVIVTVKAGVWTDPSVWSTNIVPNETNDVEIRHLVNLPSGTIAKAKLLRYSIGGKLNVDSNAHLKIRLE
ncbi:fibronectin type III domain-containing protein [Spirosoma daeguense]